MGLFSSMPRKPMAAPLGMKPMTPPVEPIVSSGHQDKRAFSQHGHGRITGVELDKMSYRMNHALRSKRGGEIAELFKAEADKHGGVLKERQVDEIMHGLKRNHHDDIRQRDIDKLEDIVDSKL